MGNSTIGLLVCDGSKENQKCIDYDCPHRELHSAYGPNCVNSTGCCGKSVTCRPQLPENSALKEWSIWSEGYSTTGQEGGATFHGKKWAETFQEACNMFFEGDTTYDSGNLTYWACNLYDNQGDARRGFG